AEGYIREFTVGGEEHEDMWIRDPLEWLNQKVFDSFRVTESLDLECSGILQEFQKLILATETPLASPTIEVCDEILSQLCGTYMNAVSPPSKFPAVYEDVDME
ncbi:hypothetical protein Pmar_PMAR021986, partial [Perkinsus marinus ATCC 50983]